MYLGLLGANKVPGVFKGSEANDCYRYCCVSTVYLCPATLNGRSLLLPDCAKRGGESGGLYGVEGFAFTHCRFPTVTAKPGTPKS